jgi:hypothetical protein
MATPLVYVADKVEYVSALGGASFTVMIIAEEILPPEFVAVTV